MTSRMEFWSFPPAYDHTYMPNPKSKYWLPMRETMDPGERDQKIVVRLQKVMAYAYKNSTFYRNRWDDAGIHPEHINSLEDFERVPVITKQELRAAQERSEPFGDYLCVPDREVHHIHGTSGTTGRPTVFAIGREDWGTIAENQARILWAMGLRPGGFSGSCEMSIPPKTAWVRVRGIGVAVIASTSVPLPFLLRSMR